MRRGFLIHIWGNSQIFSPHIWRSLVIYDFAPDPSEFPNIWGKSFAFLSVWHRVVVPACQARQPYARVNYIPQFSYYEYGYRAGIFIPTMGAGNRVGIGLSYRPARLHRLAEFIPWNRFLGSLKFKNSASGLLATCLGASDRPATQRTCWPGFPFPRHSSHRYKKVLCV
jgi:hypothetical protein